jgi:hypothetical protein
MKTKLTQKQLVQMTRKYGISIHPKMPKKHIMLFIDEALDGNNAEWLPLAKEVQCHICYEFFDGKYELDYFFEAHGVKKVLN